MFSASRVYVPTPNQRLILELIRTRGPISRADIVRLSGLTFPSVSRIVGELIGRNLVEEKRQRRGGMGKPPTELELNPKGAFSVGLSLDYDELSAALIDLSGVVLASSRVAVDDPGPEVRLWSVTSVSSWRSMRCRSTCCSGSVSGCHCRFAPTE